MTERDRIIMSWEFHKALLDAGVITPDVRRVIIEAEANRPTVIYLEKYGTAALLEVVPVVLKGAEVRVVGE